MTTFMYTTTSTEGHLNNTNAVEDLVSEYYFTVEPQIENDTIVFLAEHKPNSAFEVYESVEQMNSVTEEFLEQLSEHLKNMFEVRCVEVEGVGQPEAWKWEVTPEGDVTNISL